MDEITDHDSVAVRLIRNKPEQLLAVGSALSLGHDRHLQAAERVAGGNPRGCGGGACLSRRGVRADLPDDPSLTLVRRDLFFRNDIDVLADLSDKERQARLRGVSGDEPAH